MTLLLITGNSAAGWWVSQQARGVTRRWMMRNGNSGGKRRKKEKQNRKKQLTALQVRRLDPPFGQMINKDVWFYCSLWNQYSVFFLHPFSTEQKPGTKNSVVLTWMMALGPSILDCDSRWKYEDTLKPTDSSQPLPAERLADLLTAGSWSPLTATHIALHMSRTVWQSQLPIMILVLGFQGVFHVIVSDSVFCTRWCRRSCQVVQCVKTVIGKTDNLKKDYATYL